MSDHDPLLLRRLLELRRFPLLTGAELGELAVLAENAVETVYPSGALVAEPARLAAVHLVLGGQIDAGPARSGPYELFGWLDVLAGRPLGAPAVAVGHTRTLRIAASDLAEILEDNFGLLALALRDLATRTLAARPSDQRARLSLPGPGPLGLVERMIALRQRVPFTSARLEALAILAYESEEMIWPAGHIASRCGDPARTAGFILDGELRATPASREPVLLGSGGMVGVLESLAGLRHTSTVTAVTPVRVLEIASTAIFDVLEDHSELGLAMLATFAGDLLDAAPSALARAS
jgi:CRP-like cAMP-binding protein